MSTEVFKMINATEYNWVYEWKMYYMCWYYWVILKQYWDYIFWTIKKSSLGSNSNYLVKYNQYYKNDSDLWIIDTSNYLLNISWHKESIPINEVLFTMDMYDVEFKVLIPNFKTLCAEFLSGKPQKSKVTSRDVIFDELTDLDEYSSESPSMPSQESSETTSWGSVWTPILPWTIELPSAHTSNDFNSLSTNQLSAYERMYETYNQTMRERRQRELRQWPTLQWAESSPPLIRTFYNPYTNRYEVTTYSSTTESPPSEE